MSTIRRNLRRTALVFGAALALAFVFSRQLIVLVAQPLVDAWERHADALGKPSLHFKTLLEPFWVTMTLAFWAALVTASPFVLHHIWRVVSRMRAPTRARLATPFALASATFFVAGAGFCYLVVLPLAFDFFLGYADANLASMSSALGFDYQIGSSFGLKAALYLDPYLSLTLRLLIAFGLVFELPMVIFFLASVGLVTHRGLWRFNRWAVVLAFAIAAVLTPGPDVVSQVLMAVPLVVLYNLSIAIAYVVTRAAGRAADPPP